MKKNKTTFLLNEIMTEKPKDNSNIIFAFVWGFVIAMCAGIYLISSLMSI